MKINWIATAVCWILTGTVAFALPAKPVGTRAISAQAIASTTSRATTASQAKPGPKQAKKPSESRAPTAPTPSQTPFINNHYVLTGSFPVNGFHKGTPAVVVVDKSSHLTYVLQLQDEKIVRVLTVSNDIGDVDTPTPPGRYTVLYKKMYPSWIPPPSIKHAPVPPYNETHKNPLGVAAIYLNKFDIDLHGTNEPKLIRHSTSHGCVRHSNADILKLYSMVNSGDVVYIVNHFKGKVLNKADFVRTTRFKHKHHRH